MSLIGCARIYFVWLLCYTLQGYRWKTTFILMTPVLRTGNVLPYPSGLVFPAIFGFFKGSHASLMHHMRVTYSKPTELKTSGSIEIF